MAHTRRVSFVLLAVLASCVSLQTRAVHAQDADAILILKKAAATYRSLKNYEARISVATIDGTQISERHFLETGSAPAYRLEDANPSARLRVDDGQTQWTLDRKTNQYAKEPSSSGTPSYIESLAQLDQNIKSAEVLREDIFSVDGKQKKYYIALVERTAWPRGTIAGAQYATIRVDEETYEVAGSNVYADKPVEMLRYSLTRRDPKISATQFKFSPPAAAKEVASLAPEQIETKPIIGSEAPDFTLSDVAGHAYHLRDLRGKVVVVDFWASWCGPCRASMPNLQKISQDYGNRGVVVLGLDGGEDGKTVTDFAQKEHYTFPLLLGGEPTVTEQYFLVGYPTVAVVDRTGHITYREEGYESPKNLLAAIDAAARSN